MKRLLKICGLSTPESVAAAIDAGADMIGLNFHPKSPRTVSPEQAAALAVPARGKVEIVALVVDADDALLARIATVLKPNLWQFHGKESVDRIREVRAAHGLPAMRALGVSTPADLETVKAFAKAADHLLLDAKPPKDAAYPGGHGRPFDWDILKGLDPGIRFILAGGLRAENVAEAILAAGPGLAGVDVSSGVESAPGVKDTGKIYAFAQAARRAFLE